MRHRASGKKRLRRNTATNERQLGYIFIPEPGWPAHGVDPLETEQPDTERTERTERTETDQSEPRIEPPAQAPAPAGVGWVDADAPPPSPSPPSPPSPPPSSTGFFGGRFDRWRRRPRSP